MSTEERGPLGAGRRERFLGARVPACRSGRWSTLIQGQQRPFRDFLGEEPKEAKASKSQSQRTQQKQAFSDQVSGTQAGRYREPSRGPSAVLSLLALR